MEPQKLDKQSESNLSKFPKWEQSQVKHNRLHLSIKQTRKRLCNEVKSLNFSYINIQGLTHAKTVELNKFIKDKNEILILVETHWIYDKRKPDRNVLAINKMREEADKKGGGITVLYRKDLQIKILEKETNNPDIMWLVAEEESSLTNILIVYMSVLNQAEDKARNKRIIEEIEKIVKRLEEVENLVIIGDFNAHLEEIGPQKDNANGKVLINFTGKFKGGVCAKIVKICHFFFISLNLSMGDAGYPQKLF